MTETPGTAVARTKPLVAMVHKRADQIHPFLPKGMTLDGVAQLVELMAVKQPELRACTPSSLILGVTRGLRSGLELGETWHLLPFRNTELSQKASQKAGHAVDVYECVGTADYKGLAELMIASGAVRYVDPQVVREGDTFSYTLGLHKDMTHVLGEKRGAITHAYVVLTLPFGLKDFLVMTIAEIDAIRLAKSRSWKKGPCPPWYAKKTVIRQVAKLLPKGRKMAAVFQAVEQDEAAEVEDIPEAEYEEMPADMDPATGEVPIPEEDPS